MGGTRLAPARGRGGSWLAALVRAGVAEIVVVSGVLSVDHTTAVREGTSNLPPP